MQDQFKLTVVEAKRWIALLLATAVLLTSHCSLTQARTTPMSKAASTQAKATHPCALSTRAYPEGISDETTYEKWIEKQLADLAWRAESAKDPITRVELLLALANLRLARQAEAAMSHVALGDATPAALKRLAAVAATARKEIAQGAEELERLEKGSRLVKADTKKRDELREASSQLGALAAAMQAIGEGKGSAASLRLLDPLTKDKGLGLSSAVRLLQALLMRQAGQIDKALSDMPPALEPPKQLPHDFFLRLLRCRLLADRGSYAVATTLALRIDVQCEDWFDKSRLSAARTATALLRAELADQWAEQLRRDNLDEHAAHRAAIAEGIRTRLVAEPNTRAYRLVLAAPVLIKPPPPPAPETPKTKPTTRTKPTTTTAGSRPSTAATTRSSGPQSTRPSATTAPQALPTQPSASRPASTQRTLPTRR